MVARAFKNKEVNEMATVEAKGIPVFCQRILTRIQGPYTDLFSSGKIVPLQGKQHY